MFTTWTDPGYRMDAAALITSMQVSIDLERRGRRCGGGNPHGPSSDRAAQCKGEILGSRLPINSGGRKSFAEWTEVLISGSGTVAGKQPAGRRVP